MRTKTKGRRQALTFIELLIILVILTVLAGLLLPALQKASASRGRLFCISNLKQAGIGFQIFANDNDGQYPAWSETNLARAYLRRAGVDMNSLTNEAWSYFQLAGTEMTSPRRLVCPQDPQRHNRKIRPIDFELTDSTNNFAHPRHRNAALSYFYALDADQTRPNMFLTGDRHISTNRQTLTGLLAATTNASLRWTSEIHTNSGNIALADGSVHRLPNDRLEDSLRLLPEGAQRLILP